MRKQVHKPLSAERKEPLKRITKKEQILSLYAAGVHEVKDLVRLANARPSYVASVLQQEGLISGYFDLYTSTTHPMNVYSQFFAHKLGFKDEDIARESVALIDQIYRQFELSGDHVGQHHALVMALTMFDRARWTNKGPEAEIYRNWLLQRLEEADILRLPSEEIPE